MFLLLFDKHYLDSRTPLTEVIAVGVSARSVVKTKWKNIKTSYGSEVTSSDSETKVTSSDSEATVNDPEAKVNDTEATPKQKLMIPIRNTYFSHNIKLCV